MDITKRLQEKIIYLILIIFPFGQLIRFDLNALGRNIPILGIDLLVGTAALVVLFKKYNKPKSWKNIVAFFTVLAFSYLLSFIIFKDNLIYTGALYLVRLFSYFLFMLFVANYANKEALKLRLINSLIGVSFFTALFGWIQYFEWPDFRPFTIFGWDDHLFRLIGTFLDPGFTSIIVTFGALAAIIFFFKTKKNIYFLAFFFLVISLAFTYARAGYLALIYGLFVLAALKRKVKAFIVFLALFAGLVLILPRPTGEGTNLERTASVNARFVNYSQMLTIVEKNPLFGVGYNNICLAKGKYLSLAYANTDSHSCYGSDSSLLLILATTGVVGFSTFLYLIYKLLKDTKNGIYKTILITSGGALFVHSLFVNSLFYPFVLFWMMVLFGVSLKVSSGR